MLLFHWRILVLLILVVVSSANSNQTSSLHNYCNVEDTYWTQTQDDWSQECNHSMPNFNQTLGCLRDQYFSTCFPNGLRIGCYSCIFALSTNIVLSNHTMNNQSITYQPDPSSCGRFVYLTSTTELRRILPSSGIPARLTASWRNPPAGSSAGAGIILGQLTSLALSLGFLQCQSGFGRNCLNVGDLFVCDLRCSVLRASVFCSSVVYNNSHPSVVENTLRKRSTTGIHILADGSVPTRNERNNGSTMIVEGASAYPNCEAYYGMTVNQIFNIASEALGSCGRCGRANNTTIDVAFRRICNVRVLNDCLTLINQAFRYGNATASVLQIFHSIACVIVN